MSNSKMYSLTINREMNARASSVFDAVREGVLFLGCGAQKDSLKIDFRVGGKYFISFGADGEVNGEFTEIVPNQKIAFTWSHNNTRVAIQIQDKGNKSLLTLTHELIPSEDWIEAYRGGWEDGLKSLASVGA